MKFSYMCVTKCGALMAAYFTSYEKSRVLVLHTRSGKYMNGLSAR